MRAQTDELDVEVEILAPARWHRAVLVAALGPIPLAMFEIIGCSAGNNEETKGALIALLTLLGLATAVLRRSLLAMVAALNVAPAIAVALHRVILVEQAPEPCAFVFLIAAGGALGAAANARWEDLTLSMLSGIIDGFWAFGAMDFIWHLLTWATDYSSYLANATAATVGVYLFLIRLADWESLE